MKMKDFKAALKRKMRYIENYIDEYNDYYLGYISCMEDILEFIEGDKEESQENNI